MTTTQEPTKEQIDWDKIEAALDQVLINWPHAD
jgi:hypothetical protein